MQSVRPGLRESVLITGGARSGKSRLAEKCLDDFAHVVYLATAEPGDEEMSRRITEHRRRRPERWRTVEEPLQVVRTMARLQQDADAVLLDCVTLWLSNLVGRGDTDQAILDEVRHLADLLAQPACCVILVTNEVGEGIVPAHPVARRFRDLMGSANQILAGSARSVFKAVCGYPLRIK